jgi:hypothetical protein
MSETASVMVYPGPDSIPPDACPGGWFIHVYDRHGVLVLVRALPPGILFAEPDLAKADAELVTMMVPGEMCLVFYDGDTGERVRPPFHG